MPGKPQEDLLSVTGLTVRYRLLDGRAIRALAGARFRVRRGESLGILGESGSGKTTLALSLLRLLPASAEIAGGSIRFGGEDLCRVTESRLREIRGAQISLVPQEPGIALCPVYPVGEQVAEVLIAHGRAERCREEAVALLEQAGLRDVPRLFHAYPHQLSGGQLQRVAIAQALACRPQLLVADEPTSSLDSTVQAGILTLLEERRRRQGLAFVWISHDPAILARTADRILVLYGGEVVEEGTAEEILHRPLHPYTQALLKCASERLTTAARQPLPAIPGESPDPSDVPAGCAFEPRCPVRMERCRAQSPGEFVVEGTRCVRCFNYEPPSQ